MTSEREINVMIGEVKVGQADHRLQAILGSCIGIALLDVQMGRCTLSHSLLPFHNEGDPARPGRWVNQAVLSAIDLLNVAPGRIRRLHAIVAGGSSMIDGTRSRHTDIGRSNTDAAKQILEELNINVVAQEVGGTEGRKISVCSNTLEYDIAVIPRTLTKEATA